VKKSLRYTILQESLLRNNISCCDVAVVMLREESKEGVVEIEGGHLSRLDSDNVTITRRRDWKESKKGIHQA
jgi:hypothetical protein